MLKRAVLGYLRTDKKRFNIGDYIQSLAALQFWNGQADTIINREMIDEYDGPPAVIFMNGWFMAHPEHWPPAKQLKPCFVSFHINTKADPCFLKPASIAYFKEHEPIGCRDERSAALLRTQGVNAFFSGCLTLTLGENYRSSEKNGKVYFADPYISPKATSLARMLKTLISKPGLCRRIASKMNGGLLSRTLKAAKLYAQYSALFTDDLLEEAEYTFHRLTSKRYPDENERFELAESLLRCYAAAKFVVTSRIHCALPCLGLETPVLYVYNDLQPESSACRMDGLVDLFHVIGNTKGVLTPRFEFHGGKISSDFTFANKKDHLSLAAVLIKRCREFATEALKQSP